MKRRSVWFLSLLSLLLILSALPSVSLADAYDTVDFYNTVADFQAQTGAAITAYAQSPDLKAREDKGEIPPVALRVSEEPMVIVPLDSVGIYGGRIRSAATSPTTGSAETWTGRTQPLLIVGPDLASIRPNIAKGWQFNGDYTELTVTLRKGMCWSDGAPFTADDFAFYWDKMILSDDIFPIKPEIWTVGGELATFEVVNPYEVKYTFAAPNPTVINYFATNNRMYHTIPFAPAHYLSQFLPSVNPDADKVAKAAGYDDWKAYFLYLYPNEVQARLDPALPGVDPWILTRVDEVGNKYFDRNPYYWKVDTAGNQLPYIDGQDRMLLDKAAITMQLLAGNLDYCLQFTSVDDYALYVENAETANLRIALWTDARGSVLADMRPNLNYKLDEAVGELLRNLKFREALSLAVNRDEVNQIIWKGLAKVRAATVSPNVPYFEDWMERYMAAYDVDGANARLDEIGLVWDSAHAYRLRPDGKPLELIVEYTAFEGNVTTIMELVKGYWEKIGVKTTLKAIDQSLFDVRTNASEMVFYIWNLDNGTAIGHQAAPLLLGPYANDYALWRTSLAAQGTEPDEQTKEFYATAAAFSQVALGEGNYNELGGELLALSLRNMWHIGIAGMTPKPMVVKGNLLNTPTAGIYDYDYRYWMVFHPEQWYWGAE